MAAYIAIGLSLVSIILLIIVISNFKRLFSVDSIEQKIKNQMNKIILDINKNAKMDLDLINEATKRTRTLMNEADKKMEELKEATDLLRDMIATVDKAGKKSGVKVPIYKNSLIDEIKPISQIKKYSSDQTEKSRLNKKVIQGEKYKNQQQSLFEDYSESYNKSDSFTDSSNSGDIFNSKSNSLNIKIANEADLGGSEKNNYENNNEDCIPNIVTNIVAPESFNKNSNLNYNIERLFNMGMNVNDIALELSCSISEVQFVVDMLRNRG